MTTQTRTDVDPQEVRRLVDEVPSWHHRMEVVSGVWSRGNYDPQPMLDQMGLPARLDGVRVLDVGCNDGFFSFALEQRGASVRAIDFPRPSPGFALTHRLRDSSVEFASGNVYSLTAADHGTYDVVLFLGVLYHLRHPLLALDVLSTLVAPGGVVYVETHAIDQGLIGADGRVLALGDPSLRVAQFYPYDELSGDNSNWWAPSLSCLEAMVESALFRIEYSALWTHTRALVKGRRDASLEPAFYTTVGGFHGDTASYFPPGALTA